jgi:hypothetical protein
MAIIRALILAPIFFLITGIIFVTTVHITYGGVFLHSKSGLRIKIILE